MLKDAARTARDTLVRSRLSPLSRKVLDERLTYLKPSKLRTLERCVEEINRNGVPGIVIEAGVALGGSAIVLASTMGPDRRFEGYDVFGLIPPPGERDHADAHERYELIAGGKSKGLGGDDYYGYRDNLFDQVRASFRDFGVEVDDERVSLKRGLFEDTLHPDGPVALVHIDSDWYEPVLLCLTRIAPHLSENGLVVLDDYNDYAGCRDAVNEFLAGRDDIELRQEKPNAVLVRRGAGSAPA